MKITLLHPSRGRAEKAFEAYLYWILQSGNVDIEHILSLDEDDRQVEFYKKNFAGNSTKIIINNNSSVVEATNKAAEISTGDILVYMSDDFLCPENWDELIVNKVNGNIGKWLLKVDDCLQKFSVPVLTIPIMSRALYERLSYFWNPLYKSMFVDEDLFWVCNNNRWMIEAPELKFPHEHCSIGKAENDETYKRSAANWDQGKAVFAKRKSEGFPV